MTLTIALKMSTFFFFVGIKRKLGNARLLKNAASAIVGSKEKWEASALPNFVLKFKIAASQLQPLLKMKLPSFDSSGYYLLICTNYSHQPVSLQSRQPVILVNLNVTTNI